MDGYKEIPCLKTNHIILLYFFVFALLNLQLSLFWTLLAHSTLGKSDNPGTRGLPRVFSTLDSNSGY